MGGDPIPGLHDFLRERYEAWRARFLEAMRRRADHCVDVKVRRNVYLHGKLGEKKEAEG